MTWPTFLARSFSLVCVMDRGPLEFSQQLITGSYILTMQIPVPTPQSNNTFINDIYCDLENTAIFSELFICVHLDEIMKKGGAFI